MLFGDKRRLLQVLINLVNNAIKFTRHGSIIIEASYDSDKNDLQVSVKDSGCGIAKEEMPKLFKQFGKLLRTAE